MAFIKNFTCTVCLKEKQESISYNYPNICNECRIENEKIKRVGTLLGLKELSIEKRLEKIEAWIYDYNLYQKNNVNIDTVKFC